MKKLFMPHRILLILPLIALSGCTTFSANKDLKSPCTEKTASLAINPCNPMPINIG